MLTNETNDFSRSCHPSPDGASPLVVIVLLNWNNWRDTSECVRSLRGLTYSNYRIVVVDNGSTDESVAELRSRYPEVPVIENGENLGFAKGCNVGIRRALSEGADFVWLLNNDTVVDSNALSALVERALNGERIGAVGSVLYYMSQPERVQAWCGGYVNFWIGRSRLFTKPVRDAALEYIYGASMLIRAEALRSVDLLDEGFYMSWEETDFCFRLRAAGWKLAAASGSVVYHKVSATFTGKRSLVLDTYFTESARRFFRKHGRVPALSFWAGVSLSMLKRVLLGRWKSVGSLWPRRRVAQ
jgi:GT2 family glycosyltransferase